MKNMLAGIMILGSFSLLAGEAKTICGKPEIRINGVKIIRSMTYGYSKEQLDYQILVNGQNVGAAGYELDLMVARVAIEEGAELCQTTEEGDPTIMFRSEQFTTKKLYIKR
jgi:hypothetical protein